MAGIKPRLTIKWFELQYLCWECSGNTDPYATLEDVVHELTDCTDYRPINVRTINEQGVPATHDFIEWNDCYLETIEPYDYRTGDQEATTAYSYQDDEDNEKVIFLFNKKGY